MNVGALARWGLLLGLGLAEAHGAQAIISDFSPKVGSAGDTVIITGSGFTSGTISILFWDNQPASFYINSDLQITAIVPSGIGTGPLAVQQNGGQPAYSTADFLAIGPGPYIASFSPAYGSSNDLVVISGAHFGGVPANGVLFHGTPSRDAGVNAAGDTINVHVPYGATTGPLTVIAATGTSNSQSAFTVVGAGPYITGFSPIAGGAGTPVNIYGVHFNSVTAVRFNGKNAPGFVPTSYTQITVPAPTGVTTGPLTVEAPTGTNTTVTNFFAPPSITSVSPHEGRAGTNVVITGTNLLGCVVTFNGTSAAILSINNSNLTATVPAGAVSGKIRVTTPAGSAFSGSPFHMLPTVFGFSPAVGRAGTNVIVTGANLNEGLSSVQFNSVAAAFSSVSYGQLTATVPAATTGPISVTTSNGTFTTLTNFFLPPGITRFTPTNSAPGTRITVTGANFLGATAVAFNGLSASSFNVSNNTTLGATVPPGVITGPLTVSAPAGQATSPGLFYGAPLITGFAPAHGLPGTNVTIIGTNFLGASAVWFNSTPGTIKSVNNGMLVVSVPNGAQSGPLTVAAPGGTNSSTTPFILDYSSDLQVWGTNSPTAGTLGSNLVYTLSLVNNGPYDAPNATVTNFLPAGVALVSASITSPWTLSTSGNLVVGAITTFRASGTASLVITVRTPAAGSLVDTVQVSSGNPDPNLANNVATLTTVIEPLAFLSIGVRSNQVTLSWPVALSNFVLESSPSLTGGSPWVSNATPPSLSGANWTVTETNTGAAKFYRLQQ